MTAHWQGLTMNDPHVVALNYRISHNETIDYSEAEPFDRDESGFRLMIENKAVRFELKDHYATEEQARKALDAYIRVWEFNATLEYGNPDSFRLVFDKAEIIDRNPTPSAVRLSAKVKVQATGSAMLTTSVRKYPSPPTDIALNSDVETMYQRYMAYRGKREPLPSMAYFCLSMLEDPPTQQSPNRRKIGNKRKAAAEKFDIDVDVLNEIGRLSSTRGDTDARKREGVSKSLSLKERRFLDRAIREIIRRVAERSNSPDTQLRKISMSCLPALQGDPDADSRTNT